MDEQPVSKLPQDEYSIELRRKKDNPGVIEKQSTIERIDFYGNAETWIVRTFRVDGAETIFMQRNHAAGGDRWMLPPDVVGAIIRQHDGIMAAARRRAAGKAAATRKALGIEPGFRKGKK